MTMVEHKKGMVIFSECLGLSTKMARGEFHGIRNPKTQNIVRN